MDWQTLRNQFMRDIGGDPPGSQLEDELIRAYTDHPDVVERSMEKIGLAHTAGKIRSPWGALKTEVAKAANAMTPGYRNALRSVFGNDWREGHERVKHWDSVLKGQG